MENRCPECGTTLPRGVPAWTRHLTVADVMTKDPVTLGPEDSLMKGGRGDAQVGDPPHPDRGRRHALGLLAEGDLKRAQPSALSDSEEEFRTRDGRRRRSRAS